MSIETIKVTVHGRVQGVCFREYTRQKADELGINGYVRNLPNGDVEAVISGPEDKLDELIAWFYFGSPYSSVSGVERLQITPDETFTSFSIRF